MIQFLNTYWKQILEKEFMSHYFVQLNRFLLLERLKYTVYPKLEDTFTAFSLTPFKEVKVVIIGQDPYHGEGEAHGLLFSVPKKVKIPPSLKNIYKELHNDIGIKIPNHGNLENWAKKGVFLINCILTVREKQPTSHSYENNKKELSLGGWEKFTDVVIRKLSDEKDSLVFFLWGNYAYEKEKLIDSNKHLVLKASHPSPYSANYGFFGCKHFSKCNKYLEINNLELINWEL